MRFSTFIKQLPKSADSDITHFIKWVELKKNLPVSSDPRALGLFLANKLLKFSLNKRNAFLFCII